MNNKLVYLVLTAMSIAGCQSGGTAPLAPPSETKFETMRAELFSVGKTTKTAVLVIAGEPKLRQSAGDAEIFIYESSYASAVPMTGKESFSEYLELEFDRRGILTRYYQSNSAEQ